MVSTLLGQLIQVARCADHSAGITLAGRSDIGIKALNDILRERDLNPSARTPVAKTGMIAQ
jgi:hypothetical protein